MSKRHQSSRRRSYGRRQHEVHERDGSRRHHAGARGARARRLRRLVAGRSRSPSSIRARRGSASRSASRWRSTRGPPSLRRSCPGGPRVAERPDACPAGGSAAPSGRVAGAEPPRRSSSAASSSRSCSRSSRWPRASASRRRATTSTGSARERDALLVRKQELLTDLNRLGQRAGDPQAGDRRRPEPARRARSSCRRD